MDTAGMRGDVEGLGVEILPLTADHAEEAARLWAPTRKAGLSLGDRACLAVARLAGSPAVTADRAWGGLDLGVTVQLIR